MAYPKEFALTEDDDFQIPIELRERHFHENHLPEVSVVQSIGRAILVSIWSPRDFIQIEIPVTEWCAERPYKRSLQGNRIDFRRWMDVVETDERDGRRVVHGLVRTESPEWIPNIPK